MTPRTLKEWQQQLRDACNARELTRFEQLLNATKGQGATTVLADAAIANRFTLLTHSQKWAEELLSFKPALKAMGFDDWTPSQSRRVLYDNGLFYLCVRRANTIRALAEGLLNYMEQIRLEEPKK